MLVCIEYLFMCVCTCLCRVRGFSWGEATFAQLYLPQTGTHADLSKHCTEVLLMNQWVLLALLTGNSDTSKGLLTGIRITHKLLCHQNSTRIWVAAGTWSQLDRPTNLLSEAWLVSLFPQQLFNMSVNLWKGPRESCKCSPSQT